MHMFSPMHMAGDGWRMVDVAPGAMINAQRLRTGPAQGPPQHHPKRGNLVLLGVLRGETTSESLLHKATHMHSHSSLNTQMHHGHAIKTYKLLFSS